MLVVTSAYAGPAVTARTPTSVPAPRTVLVRTVAVASNLEAARCAPAPYHLMTECSHVSNLPICAQGGTPAPIVADDALRAGAK